MSNYYDILQIPITASKAEIKNSYNKLVKIYYPDKNTGNPIMFEKIVSAYNTLMNDINREKYDKTFELVDLDFVTLKSNYNKDVKVINIPKSNIEFKPNKEDAIDKEELKMKIQDYELMRSQDDIENTQVNMFENENFDSRVFNSVYEDVLGNKDLEIISFDNIETAYDDSNFYSNLDGDCCGDSFENYFNKAINLNEINVKKVNLKDYSISKMSDVDMKSRLDELIRNRDINYS
jgi:curved DNA-binding protein CbpA